MCQPVVRAGTVGSVPTSACHFGLDCMPKSYPYLFDPKTHINSNEMVNLWCLTTSCCLCGLKINFGEATHFH